VVGTVSSTPVQNSAVGFVMVTMTACKVIPVGMGEAAYTEPLSMEAIMANEVANAQDDPSYFFSPQDVKFSAHVVDGPVISG
jgi:hypothetical protein